MKILNHQTLINILINHSNENSNNVPQLSGFWFLSAAMPKRAAVNERKLRRNRAEDHTKLYIERHYFANTCPSSTLDAGRPIAL
ncbi:hypothetical protein AB3X28_12815 [Raoultella terrigena]|uniref:hypothetical protein n=1 Tax=Raoultella terrigena TaxID=577 RepID=UPI00349F475B